MMEAQLLVKTDPGHLAVSDGTDGRIFFEDISAARNLSIAVVIASLGRPELIRQMMDLMAQQTSAPDLLLFSITQESDWPLDMAVSDQVHYIIGPKGLCRQRNAALEHLKLQYDIIVFYDDDFVPSRKSISNTKVH